MALVDGLSTLSLQILSSAMYCIHHIRLMERTFSAVMNCFWNVIPPQVPDDWKLMLP